MPFKKKIQAGWESVFSTRINSDDVSKPTNSITLDEEEQVEYGDLGKLHVWESEDRLEENESSENQMHIQEEEELLDSISLDDAVAYIAAVFIQNNISHIRSTMEKWSNYDTRTYSFCSSCSSILTPSKKCTNNFCRRYSISQANMSSLKTVVTYSIRKQFEELLESGAFDDSILTRLQKKPMICGRLCDTEKYKDRLRKSENEYPNLITLFCSLNTDGFRKRGCARGEIWPIFLAAHDVAKGTGSFREYQSQFIILSGIMQTNTKLKPADFESFFERMKLELEEITKNPLKLKLGDNEFEVRIELLQSILDMDASKKIRGLPVWQSYDSCSLCNIEGKQIRTKNGRKICWYSKDESDEYDDSFLPEKLLNTCLPPPWADGFDNLHIIAEGTSRDLMKDLLGNGSKTGFPIRKKIRVEWAAALSAANTPRGRSSASLIDPIQLSTRTGSEVQQLFDIAVPTLIVLQKTPTEWTVMLLLHWLVTRSVTDCHLTEQKCEQIDRIHPTLRQIVGKRFPSLFTMKFHYFIDHLTPSIQYHGSPSLSSASPFERLNQTLGRSSNSFTTRTLVNISNRFMAMKRAVQHCTSPLYQTRMDPPLTIKGSIGFNDEKNCNVTMGEDNEDLTRAESEVLKSGRFRSNLIFRTMYDNGKRKFSIRRMCRNKLIHNCYIYYEDQSGCFRFGSIERIFITRSEETFVILQKFITVDPFQHLALLLKQYSHNLDLVSNETNDYFRKIVGTCLEIIDAKLIKGFVTIIEYSNHSYVSRC